MTLWFSFAVAMLALIVSAITCWLTFFRRGRLGMTQPTLIFFGPDGPSSESGKNKVFLRTLLYCTAKRGIVVESLHVALHRNESKQNFSFWNYGSRGNLSIGSGLFVPQEGVAFDHHFLQPNDGANFPFLAGSYRLVVFAKLVGDAKPKELLTVALSLSDANAHALVEHRGGAFFIWGPDQQSYHAHVDLHPEAHQRLPFPP